MKRFTCLAILMALILTLGSVSAVQAEILPPRGMGQIGYQAVVLCESLTVRQKASASSKTVATLQYGDWPIVMNESNGWAYCVLGDAEDSPAGWVNADYIVIDPSWYRTEKKEPVYAWNDLDAPKVALLDPNTTLPILKIEKEWIVVSLRGASGWIHRNTAQ